jgi:hypothetical protein
MTFFIVTAVKASNLTQILVQITTSQGMMSFGFVHGFQNVHTCPSNYMASIQKVGSTGDESDSCSGGVEISAGIWATPTGVFHGFPQSHQANVRQ